MPTRPVLCLLAACAGVAVVAIAMNVGGSGRPQPSAESVAAQAGARPATAPEPDVRPRATLRGGGSSARPALRWHSFLPGMFR